MPVYRFDVGKSRAAILVNRAQSRRVAEVVCKRNGI